MKMVSILPSFVSFMIIKLVVESGQGASGIEFRLRTFDEQARDGIAEIFYNGTWGAVDIQPNFVTPIHDFSAKALCNSMGFGYEGFVTWNRNLNTSGTVFLTWLTGFTCTANHTNATNCLNETALNLGNRTVSTILNCYPLEITDIRLVKGKLLSEGLLEVNVSNRWAAVCDYSKYNFKDTLDDMICRTLGYVEESVIQPAVHGRPYAIMKLQLCPSNIISIYDITRQCEIQTVWQPMGYDEVYKHINCQPTRLVDGPSALKGRVEAGLFGQLRTICGLGFDVYAANVACTSLGYSGSANFSLKTKYGFGNVLLYRKKISCSGNELSLEHCNHSVVDFMECGYDDVVSVDCRGGQMKLNVFNTARLYEGLFTAFYGGHWYDVLDNVSINTAKTLCSLLGFGYVGFPALSRYGKYLEYYKTNISCRGNESHVDECSGVFQYCTDKSQENCFRTSLSGLLALFCSDYTIQKIALVHSDVQLTVNNETWSVCNHSFTSETAESVCRILGYVGENNYWSSLVSGSDKAIIGDLICESGATTVKQCQLRHQFSYRLYAEGRACSEKVGITCKEECRQGFFGYGCSQCHCKSENTLSCNTITGECTCIQGWSGLTCSDDVNECETATVCKSPLICMNTAGSYVCQCPVGMYLRNSSDGEQCEGAPRIEFRLRTFDDQARDGIAEIFYNGIWGAVDIQPNFVTTTPEFSSKALCNSMGFGYEGFITLNMNHNASGTVFLTWLTGFTCTTNHTNATECLDETAFSLRNSTVSTILHCYTFEITDVRLSGGILPNEGLLEARISKRWAAIRYVSRYNVKDPFDDLICRTLGYVEESVIPPANHGMPYAIMIMQSCPDNLSSIYDITRQCSTQNVWLSYGRDELYKEINCQPIRLIDGPSSLEGRVEAGLFGKLRTICGLGFDEHAANVTCNSLGKSGLAHFNLKTMYGTGNVPLYSRKISCSGTELTLEHCNHSDFDIEACGEEDVVSVTCIGGPMKLEVFKKARPYEGLFTAYHGGHQYDVLGNVSLSTARNLCSMLGFGYVGFSTLSLNGKFLEYYKTNLSCNENASHIDECSGDLQYCANKGQDNCYKTSLTGLLALFCSDYEIQHLSVSEIVIELTINNETWSVCEDDFAAATADSVCRIAGYTGSIMLTSAPVHGGDNEIIGSLLCEPGASTLQECKIRHQYRMHAQGYACSHKIALSCQNVLRLVDGPSSTEGRVETVLFGHQWIICGLGFDEKAAKVVCTSLGYSELSYFNSKTTYGVGNLTLYSKNISCFSGNELTLEECGHSKADNEACGKNDVVSVACSGGQIKLEKIKETRRYEGVLSTYYNGFWYDILGPVSNTTARTLCSMLGFGAVGFSAPSKYGKSVYRYQTNISCHGNESHINECSGELQYCIAKRDSCYRLSLTAGRLTLFCSDYDIQNIALVADIIELTINNETWSVCDDYFTAELADSVCRILGYRESSSFWSDLVQDGDIEVIGNLLCESGAVTLSDCKLKHKYSYQPSVSESDCSKRIQLRCKNECRQGFFGPNCSQCLCNSLNTQSCHNVTGECKCKQGWSGTTCNDDVNECLTATDICKDPSVCENTAGSYFCQCPVGMYMRETSCEAVAEAEGMSSLTITAIASSAGGSIIIVIVVIAVAVACVRRHKGKAERYKNESKEKHCQQPSVENTEGTDDGEADHYIVLDGFNRENSPYQKIKHEDDAKNGYIELSKCSNDNYDVLDDAKIQQLRSEDMVSDGYFTPNCGKNDDKYVSSGYLKPISKDNRMEGDYLKPQRTDQGASNDYLRI